ncbi:hypothetical protein CEP51_016117 [Fusarium floridanum]|uniref:FAD-binding domain-containing protein n=1 Tax=Fusarium floridanum TaxID=1325733 RepID=A0A428NWS8_9HYPO|nr:hypothetical protein CEP51_016117 [Fusarium floridanum]
MVDSSIAKPLRVAIVGGGPAGLGAAIALSKHPFVEVVLYEKKPEISEIGNGLSIQRNTWRMLERLGASRHITADEVFRPRDGHVVQHRNGRTGQLVDQAFSPANIAPHQEPCRAQRSVLQQALLKEVPAGIINIGKKLTRIERLPSGKIELTFADGSRDQVDLLVGADGIRSVVRQFAFPYHGIAYTGATSYRTVIRKSDALAINGVPNAVTFWHGTDGKWAYTCPLGGDDFEITAKINEADFEGRSSWGKEASVHHFVDSFTEFVQPVQQLLGQVTFVQQFDFFAGPKLETVVSQNSVALIGDASHPLSGAFGAGAGFALEDAVVLAGAIGWAHESGRGLGPALALFDRVRSRHYAELYAVLDGFARSERELGDIKATLEPNAEIESRISSLWAPKHNWMYYHEANDALQAAIQAIDRSSGTTTARL